MKVDWDSIHYCVCVWNWGQCFMQMCSVSCEHLPLVNGWKNQK